MTDVYGKRQQRLAKLLSDAELKACAFVPGPNFYYLTGESFSLMERPTILIITDESEMFAVIPELERLKWTEAWPNATTLFWQDSEGYDSAFRGVASRLPKGDLGVEGGRMRMFESDALRRSCVGRLVRDASRELEGLRMSKDRSEIELLQKAIDISEAALAHIVEQVKEGDSERSIVNRLAMRMLELGADGLSFGPIVLAGDKSANPHGTPGEKPLKAGEAMLIDFGAKFGGYNADITRTFFCKYVPDEHAAMYETVLSANELGREICRAGMSPDELDKKVTGVLNQSPFADLVVHKTGHGLGLDVHEAPQIMIGNMENLAAGALITIEPGLYRAGEIGIRIEDDVLVKPEGSQSLTRFDRSLRVVG